MVSAHSNIHQLRPRLRLVCDNPVRKHPGFGPASAFTLHEVVADSAGEAGAAAPAGE